MAGATSQQPTQAHLPIAGIQDGATIMSDGSIRVVLKVEPINFDLKSETEQNGIIYSYQSFLNSLDFPVQIVVQSKKLDLERYLMRLEGAQRTLTNELLQIQIEDYVGFVRRLISVANIMSKRFYVVISYSAALKTTGSAQINSLLHRRPSGPLMDKDQFERFRNEAYNRAGMIAGGLGRLGIKCRLLSTQELIELFYGIYNPDVATEERLTDVDMLNSGVVRAPGAMPMQAAAGNPADTVPAAQAIVPDAAMPVAAEAAPAPDPNAPLGANSFEAAAGIAPTPDSNLGPAPIDQSPVIPQQEQPLAQPQPVPPAQPQPQPPQQPDQPTYPTPPL